MSLIERSDALFSPCRTWRYRLWREWDAHVPRALFILMNPSVADEVRNDPTVERQRRRVLKWNYTKRLGRAFGSVEVCNVFAWRETDSIKLAPLLAAGKDIIGPDNDAAILAAAEIADIIVCGWGKPGNLGGRGNTVANLLHAHGYELHALAVNGDGSPQHPLYIGYDVTPAPYP